MDFLYSGAVVRAVSTEAVALYQHLGPARLFLLRPMVGLCCNVLGLSSELFGRRHCYSLREIRRAHGRARLPGSAGSFEVWTSQGSWFWYAVNPQRTGGTIGAAETKTEAIREARLSIEEMSARQARAAAAQFNGDATAIEESDLKPAAFSSPSRWMGSGGCGEITCDPDHPRRDEGSDRRRG
jgi:hypothetical protein